MDISTIVKLLKSSNQGDNLLGWEYLNKFYPDDRTDQLMRYDVFAFISSSMNSLVIISESFQKVTRISLNT